MTQAETRSRRSYKKPRVSTFDGENVSSLPPPSCDTNDPNTPIRQKFAIQFRLKGMPYAEIAEKCGYASAGAAYTAIHQRLQEELQSSVEELRNEEMQKLNNLEQTLWPLVLDETNKSRLFAVDRLMAVLERRSKLAGIDVPVDQAMFANNIIVRAVPANLFEQIEEKNT